MSEALEPSFTYAFWPRQKSMYHSAAKMPSAALTTTAERTCLHLEHQSHCTAKAQWVHGSWPGRYGGRAINTLTGYK